MAAEPGAPSDTIAHVNPPLVSHARVARLALILLQAPIGWLCIGALDASPEVSGAARLYFDIRIWSAPFALANHAMVGALVGRGRTDIALALQILMNFGNIGLNFFFVYGLSLGVRGSAAGTLAAEVLAAIGG